MFSETESCGSCATKSRNQVQNSIAASFIRDLAEALGCPVSVAGNEITLGCQSDIHIVGIARLAERKQNCGRIEDKRICGRIAAR